MPTQGREMQRSNTATTTRNNVLKNARKLQTHKNNMKSHNTNKQDKTNEFI
jgi:hypothetical protein